MLGACFTWSHIKFWLVHRTFWTSCDLDCKTVGFRIVAAREPYTPVASLPRLTLRFHLHSRPFAWQDAFVQRKTTAVLQSSCDSMVRANHLGVLCVGMCTFRSFLEASISRLWYVFLASPAKQNHFIMHVFNRGGVGRSKKKKLLASISARRTPENNATGIRYG